PLLSGAAIVMRGPELLTPEELTERIGEHKVTVANIPPAFWIDWVRSLEGAASIPASLRLVIVGGDEMPAEVVRLVRRTPLRKIRLLNVYGPTETVVTATIEEVGEPFEPTGTTAPVGVPLPGRSAWVLDRGGRPLPVGVPGELSLGGLVARGYLGVPALTAERFVPDPFSDEPGARLYRTGDLVRRLPGGELEFVGRADQQVKIRGFRVEPGEVEAALLRHPKVATAAVGVRVQAGGKILAAYAVPREGEALEVEELRRYLGERLAAYMVPTVFAVLPALPLTPNGKVDRRALAKLPLAAEVRSGGEAPETPAEELLAGAFAHVLGIERAGREDDFFRLGGHSLAAMRLVSRVREVFAVDLPLRLVFEEPTVAGLARRIEALQGEETAPPLAHIAREREVPVSFAQQRLWFLDRLEPGSSAYTIATAFRIRGPLEASFLGAALDELVRRHEVLRTVYAAPAGEPLQVVQPFVPRALPLVDLSALPEPAREAETARVAEASRRTAFDLERGPVFVATLLRLDPVDHELLLAVHHIAADGWSIGVLARELAALYRAFEAGEPSPLAPLPLQYADFSLWQRRWLDGKVLEGQLAYWRGRLSGLPALELPTDRPRPALTAYRGGREAFELPADLTAALERLGQRHGASLFMTLLAAFSVLLSRSSGQEDLAVGSPVANRGRAEVDGLIGFFVNSLVLRADLSGKPAFVELLARVRETALGAYAHQELPFERLVEEIAPERDLSRPPLFQVSFSLQSAPVTGLDLGPGIAAEIVDVPGTTAKFDLAIHLGVVNGRLAGGAEYRTDLFDPATVARLLGHYGVLLRAIAADPAAGIAHLPLLTEPERGQLLTGWNDTDLPFPRRPFHELFESWADRAPDDPAVEEVGSPGLRLTYGELDAAANRLAWRLRDLGVGPEVWVGLAVERSAGLLVGLLGILKAGGAYVPLDPAYPEDRLAYMLEATRPRVLVTEGALLDRLPAFDGPVIRLDTDAPDLALRPSTRQRVPVDPDHAAYVIFTSGSTGRPKGVVVPHAGIASLAEAQVPVFRVRPGDRLLLFAPLAFDTSVFEIVMALRGGATLLIAPQKEMLPGPGLLRLLRERRITRLTMTPSALAALPEADLPEVTAVAVAGEACPAELVARWGRDRRFFNCYGPTEMTVWVSVAELRDGSRRPPIGHPVGNKRVWVLDRNQELVPVGVVGELWVGGAGVARGYLGRPDLTAERFWPDPFSGEPGARVYRTGDLVRRLPDGSLDFVGRNDQQVKIRGFRIEPGEIETALAADPAVREAVVVAREGASGSPDDRRLVAYVVARPGQEPSAAGLQSVLRERLPEYMVPSAFVFLPELPRTPNDKVDRAALPEPEGGARPGASFQPPRTELERAVARIWSGVLGLERAGVDDSFWALGGHSLLATRVLSRVRDAFGVEIPVQAIFEAPLLADFAARIGRALGDRGTPGEAAEPALVPRPRKPGEPLPLSFGQERLWFLDRMTPGSSAYSMPSFLRLSGPLDVPALAGALAGLVRRHEALRTVFRARGGEPVQVVRNFAGMELPGVDLSSLPGEAREAEVRRLALREQRTPFDLAEGPLFRGSLLSLDAEDHVLLLNVHHIASDGWSVDVMNKDLAALYRAAAAGEPSPLRPLPVQYADFAVWQREWLSGAQLEAQLSYWRARLDRPAVLTLPADRPRPAVQSFRGGVERAVFPGGLADALERIGRRQGATLFMTLLAAFEALLWRYTGQEDLFVGTPVANRGRAEVEGLIGFFVNTLVLRTDASGDPGFSHLLARVREDALSAFAHQDFPFDRLVSELAPERDLSRTPLFQAVFALQHVGGGSFSLAPGLAASGFDPGGERTSKFDLSLHMGKSDDGLIAVVEYAADLFDAPTIRRMLAGLETLLHGIAADPEARISGLPLLSDAERRELLTAWNRTEADFPRDVGVHRLFAAQAARAPEAVAVVAEGETLTYAGLRGRAGRLARRLSAAGIGRESRVAVVLERSVDLVVAVLAVLEAGGAYVPLDPKDPAERRSFILEDTGALVLDREALTALLAGPEPADVPPAPEIGGEDLAYVVYTSGSTGRPKGVAVPHRGVARLVLSTDYVRIAPGDRVAHLSNPAFDAAVFEIWGALLTGATLVVVPPEASLSPLALAQELARREVTVALLTTAVFNRVVQEAPERLRSLRTLLFGGEAADPPSVRAALEAPALRGTRLVNAYGPTESTSIATWHLVEEVRDGGPVPIGLPIANTRVHVLDARLEPVPLGVPGELCIGGHGLARGYLGRPDLTAERFVPDPFASLGAGPGARLYRTGDLVRRRPDGAVEFLGRLDHQVKVRGFRIELGEIEATLAGHPAVAGAVALAREDEPGDRRLVAYVVPRPGETAEARALRAYLEERLPAFMVPAHVVFLDAFPLTSNGKVDRRALPAPDRQRDAGARAFTPPRTELEREVARVWSEVLRVDRVGLHDTFWDLGGHSLLATRILARIEETLGIGLPVQTIFEASSLEAFAAAVGRAFLAESGLSLEDLEALAGEEEPPGEEISAEPEPRPLSFGQERLWFLDRLLGGSPVYNMPFPFRLTGPLEVGTLAAALAEIVRRHDVLRAVFREEGGAPAQVVRPFTGLAVPVIDLEALPEDLREGEASRLIAEDRERPFLLAEGPLFRAALLHLESREHILLPNVHHIVSDGWSVDVLMGELGALYGAALAGAPSPLAPLPLQYADFAAWQREWLSGEVLEGQLAFWRERLAHPAVLELPADRPRPAVPSFRGGVERMALEGGLAGDLEQIGRRHGATSFMTLLAAFQALLSRTTGQTDVLVGTPIANRSRSEIEGIIGFFVNTLVMRTDLSGDPPFTGLLARVRDAAVGAYGHQDLPFDRLVMELAPERDLSRTPLFQVLFSLQHAAGGVGELAPGLIARPESVEAATSKFDLSLHLVQAGAVLQAAAEYSTDLFDAATVRRLLGHFETLLQGIAESPEARLSELPLLSSAERGQILGRWAGTATAYPREATIHGLFADQARRTPGAVALAFGEEEMTYGELDARANRLARRLRALGVGPEVAVGLSAERSLELIVAILGILKAGGAYVPLDPAYPAERRAHMLEDVKAPIVIGEEQILESLREGEEAAVLPDVDAEGLAYVMFTSGSTGRPKGVAVTHRNVVRLVRETGYVRFGPEEVFLQLAPVSFDASTLEIWGALLNGGRLVVAPPGPPSLAGLGRTVARHGVTTLWLTAGLFHQMVEENLPGLSPVRQLLAGGDVLSPSHVRRALRGLPGTTLINGYGPTENTTFTCCHPMTDPAEVGATVPIGRPIANTRVWLLDRNLQPVPVGSVGALYAGGDGLARGYASRPDLTAERFVPDPVSGEPGARLYATGDLARWRPDGAIEFLGRADHQVKVRGFRIELGEIETALSSHPDVAGAVVLVREDVPGDKRLVAYAVPREGAAVGERELRAHLEELLPSYMVPARFVSLPELPLTPNGKVDRRALPAPDREVEAIADLVPPRTPFEEALAGIWQSLLGLDRVGVHDDFFSLGGHSLLATQMVSRVREVFGVEIELRSVFEEPTVAELAAHVEEMGRRERGLEAPPIRPAAPAVVPPLSFSQQRLWFLDRLQPGTAVYNVPAVFRIGGALSVSALEAALSEIVRRHAALRTTFAVVDGEPVQLVAPPEPRPLPEADLSGLPESPREDESLRLAADEARRPFDLSRGPLLRWTLVRLGEEDFRLLLSMHHIVSDGWSVGVLLREMAALYGAFSAGRPSPLPELPVQYTDFAVWQRGWLQGDVLAAELASWKERLAGAPPALDLPSDRPRPAVQSSRGAAERLFWPASLARKVEEVSRKRGATVFMTLLAAFDVLLARYTGQEDLVVGSPIANRNRAETEGLIGFFVNTLVLRTDASGDPSFEGLLVRVREATLAAYAHQDLPFEKLVGELAPERDLSRSPLFQVSFMLQNAPMAPLVLGSGLTVAGEPVGTATSK
ncbi:MAG TPA: amino acid adenylation domain-containing protein, partial [Thermoanaerobaculia bacterium]|nr:amino acid adenylation domain-containing protein [Thermoanaerobaculia bacterium]